MIAPNLVREKPLGVDSTTEYRASRSSNQMLDCWLS